MSPRVDDLLVARIWIGGLPERIEETTLQEKFNVFGKISWIRIHRGTRDVFAFVQYDTAQAASDAMKKMDQANDFGAGKGGVMKVQMAKPTEVERLQMQREKALAGSGSESSSSRSRSPSTRKQRYRSPTASSRPSRRGKPESNKDLKVEPREANSPKMSQGSQRRESLTSQSRCKREEQQDDLDREGRRDGRRGESHRGGRRDDDREGRWEERRDDWKCESRHTDRNSHQASLRSASRSLTPVLRRSGKGKGKSGVKGQVQNYSVKIDNLPEDYTEEELQETGSELGKLLSSELVVKDRNNVRGSLTYASLEDAMNAMKKLHGRAMEGHRQKLKAQMPCPCCGHQLWD